MIAWGRTKRATTKRINYNEKNLQLHSLNDSSSDSEEPPRRHSERLKLQKQKKSEEESEYEEPEEEEASDKEYKEEEENVYYSSSMRKIKKVKFSSDEETPVKKKKNSKKKKGNKKKKRNNRGNTKKAEVVKEEIEEEEEENEIVQNILGIKDEFNEEDSEKKDKEDLYYVKFFEKSYIHCKWLTENQILELEGGESALRRFKSRSNSTHLSHSLSIPSLLSVDETIINSDWYEVDRIINDACEKPGKVEYLVKWKSLDYVDSTWESESDIEEKAKNKIEEYQKRLKHSNPKKIPSRWKRPSPDKYVEIKETIESKVGTSLRPYQLEGLNWLRFCWYNKRNTILADEMGLGKTAQLVTTLNSLATREKITGPFLIVAPLSTLPHWKEEFERWTDLNCVVFHGDAASRKMIIDYEITSYDEKGNVLPTQVAFDVLITNYDIFRTEYKLLQSIEWRYLVADEGHKLKNYKSKIYGLMQNLTFEHCTLLTGTPIQNDVSELWSLLHFLNPSKFNDLDAFNKRYGNMEDSNQVKELQEEVMADLLLRRRKGDVEKAILPKEETIIQVELTRIQKKLYRAFLHENAGSLLQQITGSKELPSLQNLMMQLRKVCNHPFLIKDAEAGVINEMKQNNQDLQNKTNREIKERAIVESSGKMILIDKLLPKLKADGHKVLIFSQMVRILDIIEEYLIDKDYHYERIDGSSPKNERATAITRFNEDKDRFIFLLSTKAGGVGINLTAADIVILYDSDWNPQNDIQAEARCHRIGQKSIVKVYKLITRGTYESQMFQRASKKLGLDHVVLDGGEIGSSQAPMKADEIEKMLREGAYGIFNDDDTELDNFCSADIDQILTKRATVVHDDIVSGAGSKFATARFNHDQGDDLDVNAPDFWSQVFQSNKIDDLDNDLHVRKCRQNNENKQFSENTKGSKQAIQNLIDRGFKNEKYEKIIIRIALSFVSVNSVSYQIIHHLLVGNQDEEEEEESLEFEDPIKKFGEIAFIVEERSEKILQHVSFFARLQRALYFAQSENINWPTLLPIWEDPSYEYSLMLGVYNYGWKDLAQIIDDPDLGLSKTKPMKRNAIERRIQNLFEELEKQFDTDKYFVPDDFEPMSPDNWRAKHPNLLARNTLCEHELKALIQGITSIGLPTKTNGSYDWDKLREISSLSFVSTEAVQKYSEEIYALIQQIQSSNDDRKEDDEKVDEPQSDDNPTSDILDFTNFPLLSPFSSVIHIKDIKKAQQSIKDMKKISDFISDATPKCWEMIKMVPKNQHFPKWWGRDEDEALIRSIGKYGIFNVSIWVSDPRLPFREHLPKSILDTVDKLAIGEEKKVKMLKTPKDIGDMLFLYRERSRVSRALSVIDFVQKKMKSKRGRKKSNDLYVSKPTARLLILSYGDIVPKKNYFYRQYTFAPGYSCDRMYVGPAGQTCKKWYRCEILDGGDNPIFRVTTQEEEPTIFEDTTLSGLMKQFFKHLNIEQKEKGINKLGLNLFGLSQPEVIKVYNEMKEKLNISDDSNNKKEKEPVKLETVPFKIVLPVYENLLFK